MTDQKLIINEISALTNKIIKFRNERDWGQFHNPKDLAISLSLEAGEILEHFQWKNGQEVTEHLKTKREEIAEEMADIFWYLLILSYELKVNLIQEVEQKLNKNNKRYSVEKFKGSAKKYTDI